MKFTDENRIEILGKLLDDKKHHEEMNFKQFYENALEIAERQLYPLIAKTDIENKQKIIERFRETFFEINDYLTLPSFIGNTIVGVFSCANGGVYLNKMQVSRSCQDVLNKIKDIPCIISTTNDSSVSIINSADVTNSFTENELNELIAENRKNLIDIEALAKVVVVSNKNGYKNLTLVKFPIVKIHRSIKTKNLLHKLDCMVVLGTPQSKREQNIIEFYKKICHGIGIPLYEITYTGCVMADNVAIANDIEQFMIMNDKPILNTDFKYYLYNIFLDILLYYNKKSEKNKKNINFANVDIGSIENHDIKKVVKELNEELRAEQNRLKVETNQLQTVWKKIENHVLDLQRTLSGDVKAKNICRELRSAWEDSICKAIELKDIRLQNILLYDLTEIDKNYEFYKHLISKYYKTGVVSVTEKSFLYKENTEFAIHMKILLDNIFDNGALSLSEEQFGELAGRLSNVITAKEYYYRGIYFYQQDPIAAGKAFLKAYEMGYHQLAESKLIELYHNGQTELLGKMAKQMIPVANYLWGMQHLEGKKTAKGIVNIKVAAVHGYFPAILVLGDLYHKTYKWKKKNRKELTKDDVLPLKSLYKSILEEQPDNSLVAERLGYLYSDLGEERNAIQAWSKSKTKNGYYECGKIYQYGRDTISQNLERAADYFKKAHDRGHSKARYKYNQIQNWMEKNAQRYNDESYESYSEVISEHTEKSLFEKIKKLFS